MWQITIFLLYVLVCPALGDSPEVRDLVTAAGSSMVLPIGFTLWRNQSQPKKCEGFDWNYINSTGDATKLRKERRCQEVKGGNKTVSNHYKFSENGSLVIYNVTAEDAGKYTVTVINGSGITIYSKVFIVTIQERLPRPAVSRVCYPDGRAEVFCTVQNRTDVSYSWEINGVSQQNVSDKPLHFTSPDSHNISCSVRNRVSEEHSDRIPVFCPAPVSVPVMDLTCSKDGSAVIQCTAHEGTSPEYLWDWNGKPLPGNTTHNGSQISVPSPVAGKVTCTVKNDLNTNNSTKDVFCAVPVSDPTLQISCHMGDRAVISCQVEKGSNLSYSWSLDGNIIREYSNSTLNVSGNIVTVSSPFTGTIGCSVKNSISKKKSRLEPVKCGDPLSEPVLNFSCYQNGGAEIECEVKAGEDPSYSWTLNEVPLRGNVSSEWSVSGNQLFLSSRGPWNVRCSVRNQVSERHSVLTNVSCAVKPCKSKCLQNALIGGTVGLVVTTLPLIIGCLYTMPKAAKKVNT